MSGPPTTAAPADCPDPHQDWPVAIAPGSIAPVASAPTPSRTVSLRGLIRKLIDYGKELANTLHQRTAATNLILVTLAFGTKDIAFILSRITRGLLLAVALETKVIGLIAKEAKRSAAAGATPPSEPRTPRPVDRPPEHPCLALLPTAEEIAAEVRRRPIGAILADICRDLGIMPSHPLWRELNVTIMDNGGNATALLLERLRRPREWANDTRSLIPPMPPGWRPPPSQSFLPPMPPGWRPPPRPQFGAASGTDPPEPVARTTTEA